MDVFFNELSIRVASSEKEARRWIETLIDLGKILKQEISLLTDFQTLRYSEDFLLLKITSVHTVFSFVQEQYGMSDPVTIALLSLFNSPYIKLDDPQRSAFEYTSLTYAGEYHGNSGLAAAHLKKALAVSFDSDSAWNSCRLTVQINHLDELHQEVSSDEIIQHASQRQHLIDCHLELLGTLFDWATYRPRFDYDANVQTLLPLGSLCKLLVDGGWATFYQTIAHLSERERVSKILVVADRIASIHRWHPATGSLKTQNSDRTIFTIPNSTLIMSVDTDHGEFEVHRNRQGNNHLGAVSFDGLRIKPARNDRKLNI